MAAAIATTSDWQQTRGVLRALGVRAGLQAGDKVGLAFLIAAVAKTAGQRAAEALKAAGVRDVMAFLAAIPDISNADLDSLPELKADTELAKVLQSDLAAFRAGKIGADEALKVLLSPGRLDQNVRRFLTEPRAFFGRTDADELRSTRELMRALAGYYQGRFDAGYGQYMVDASSGYSDFLQTEKADRFRKVASKLRKNERKVIGTVFASRLYDRSPLGACRRDYGELEAHILGAVILGEMTLVAQGPLSVNHLAWTVDPQRYHRLVGLVREKVAYLREEGVLVVHPDDDVRLHSQVLPASATMEEWLTFLREADPITDEEVEDTLTWLY